MALLGRRPRYEEGFSIQYRSRVTGNVIIIPGRFKWRNVFFHGRWQVNIPGQGTYYIHPLGVHRLYVIRNSWGDLYKGIEFDFPGTEITAAAPATPVNPAAAAPATPAAPPAPPGGRGFRALRVLE